MECAIPTSRGRGHLDAGMLNFMFLRLQPHIRQRLTLSPDDHKNANMDQSSFVTVPDTWLELFVVLARLSLVSSLDELGGPIVLRGESTTSEETASAPLTKSKVQK